MKRGALIGIALMGSSLASADPYVEAGLFAPVGNTCLTDQKDSGVQGCSQSPFGFLALGYRYNNFYFEVHHESSLVERDYGLTSVGVKYHYEFGSGK
jgi:hypothetical protein